MRIEFSGGLDTVFGGEKTLELAVPAGATTVEAVCNQLAAVAEDRGGDVTLFLQDGLVRPGILVLVNDADWELLDKESTVFHHTQLYYAGQTLERVSSTPRPLPSRSAHIMTKATETALFLGLLSFAWISLYLGFVPLPSTIQNEIVPVLPWWALVSFGSYALFTLGYDVVTFNDKPEKVKELREQIVEAKRDLKTNGVVVSE